MIALAIFGGILATAILMTQATWVVSCSLGLLAGATILWLSAANAKLNKSKMLAERLLTACRNDLYDEARDAIEQGAPLQFKIPNPPHRFTTTYLHEACKKSASIGLIALLRTHGGSFLEKDGNGNSLLHATLELEPRPSDEKDLSWAIKRKQTLFDYLLRQGVPLSEPNKDGLLPVDAVAPDIQDRIFDFTLRGVMASIAIDARE